LRVNRELSNNSPCSSSSFSSSTRQFSTYKALESVTVENIEDSPTSVDDVKTQSTDQLNKAKATTSGCCPDIKKSYCQIPT